MWTGRDILMNGAASGHYFENYVVSEFLRLLSGSREKGLLSFYRDTNQKEIDLILEENGVLHPLEIKRGSNPESKAIRAFGILKKSPLTIGEGGIICMTDKPFPIDSKNCYIPCNII